MTRLYGGNTVLGTELNKIAQKQDGLKVDKFNYKYGIIKEVIGQKEHKGVYSVIVTVMDNSGRVQDVGPLTLEDHPSFLAANYGPPEELAGKYYCRIQYVGSSIKRGSVSIIKSIASPNEDAQIANQLGITGTTFAPPGGGAF